MSTEELRASTSARSLAWRLAAGVLAIDLCVAGLVAYPLRQELAQQLQRGTPAGTFVTHPYLGKLSGRQILTVARRLSSPDGRFAWAVAGTFALERLSALLSTLDVGLHGSVSVRASDLSLVARSGPPGDHVQFGSTSVSPELRRVVDAGLAVGTYEAHAGAGGFDRSFAFRKLSRYPFYVLVGLAPADYLAAWRRQAELAAGLVVLFSLGTVAGAWFVHRGWRQRLQYERLLVERTERLRASEQRYRVVADNTHDWEFWAGIDGRPSYVSPSCFAISGHTADEFLADPGLLRRLVRRAAARRAPGVRNVLAVAGLPLPHQEHDPSAVVPSGPRASWRSHPRLFAPVARSRVTAWRRSRGLH